MIASSVDRDRWHAETILQLRPRDEIGQPLTRPHAKGELTDHDASLTQARTEESSRLLDQLTFTLDLEPAAAFATQALLLQVVPILIRVIDRDFFTHGHAFRHEHYSLNSKPRKPLELRIWLAGVVNKASVVPFATLPYLIYVFRARGLQDIEVSNAVCDDTDELANRCAALEWLRIWSVFNLRFGWRGHTHAASN